MFEEHVKEGEYIDETQLNWLPWREEFLREKWSIYNIKCHGEKVYQLGYTWLQVTE